MTTEAISTGEDQTAAAPTAAAAPGVAPEAVVAGTEAAPAAGAETGSTLTRPDGLDDKFWDDAAGLKVGDLMEHVRDLEAKAGAKADVPAEGEAYDLALPADFKVPEGLAVEFKADDPLWAKFQEIGKANGVDKATFGQFVGAFAEYQIAQQTADVDAYVAEKTALGANADVRIKAGTDWLKANLKADQAEALADLTVSKAGVEAIEALIRLKANPTAATPGAAASNTNQYDGLQGEQLLHAIRSKAA